MYEEHFGLDSRPFGINAEGKDVFVGPGQAKQITRLQKGLAQGDSVVTVVGEVGVGKTTAVSRALETIEGGRVVISIGRMQIEPHELMALLLAGFGVSGHIKGTVRKFAAFKRLLIERKSTVAPVAIVVEEAQKIGIDVLAELEALTAADAGDGASANIVLMGQASLHDFLQAPDLARLKQRVRVRQEIEPLTAAEVQGYLKHCIREAGGNYDLIFDQGVAAIVHQCSGGIPRVINNVCEAAMTAAMDDHSAQVTSALIAQVAAETLGYVVEVAPAEVVTESSPESSPADLVAAPEVDLPAINDLDAAPSQSESEPEPEPESKIPQDDLTSPDSRSTSESVSTVLSTEQESSAPATKDAETSNEKEDDIDWDAIAPPALAAKAAANEPSVPTVKETPKTNYQPEMIVESGNHPNINDLIAAGTQPSPAPVIAPEIDAPLATESEVAAEICEAPAPDTSDLPHLIDDTHPELRELPDITDEAILANELRELPAAKDESELGTSAEDSTETLETLDPDATPVDIDAEQDDVGINAIDNEEDSSALDTAAAVAAKSIDEIAEGTPNLDAVSSPKQSIDRAQSRADAATAEPNPSNDPSLVAIEDADAIDTESNDHEAAITDTDSAVDLPTLSDSMRIAKPANQMQAETNESQATADNSLDVQAEEAEPDLSDLLPAANVDIDPIDDASLAENDASTPAVDENEVDTGIFDQLDPLPEIDEAEHGPALAADELSEPAFTDDDGAISVPDLTIANNFDKSKNDIDALEAALEAAKQGKISAPPPIQDDAALDLNGSAALAAAESAAEPDPVDVPQITLDDELSKQQKNKPDLDQLAQEIGTAESLEDFSASMAETLFGNEAFAQIAAEVVANPPASDDNPVALEKDVSPVQLDESDIPSAANDTGNQPITNETTATNATSNILLTLEEETEAPAPSVSATSQTANVNATIDADVAEISLDDTAALRLDILNKAAAKVAGMATENVELGENRLSTTSDGMDSPKPDSIESQITTSHTQNLEALSVARIAEMEKEEEEEKQEKKSGGFFSRFRKSS